MTGPRDKIRDENGTVRCRPSRGGVLAHSPCSGGVARDVGSV